MSWPRMTTWTSGKKTLNRQTLNVVYVQYVEIKHLQSALCPTGYGASTKANNLHRRMSMNGKAKPLKYGSLKTFGYAELPVVYCLA